MTCTVIFLPIICLWPSYGEKKKRIVTEFIFFKYTFCTTNVFPYIEYTLSFPFWQLNSWTVQTVLKQKLILDLFSIQLPANRFEVLVTLSHYLHFVLQLSSSFFNPTISIWDLYPKNDQILNSAFYIKYKMASILVTFLKQQHYRFSTYFTNFCRNVDHQKSVY